MKLLEVMAVFLNVLENDISLFPVFYVVRSGDFKSSLFNNFRLQVYMCMNSRKCCEDILEKCCFSNNYVLEYYFKLKMHHPRLLAWRGQGVDLGRIGFHFRGKRL